MATQGMFSGLNKYEADLIDQANQRAASSANVGTGWEAITNAAGRAGGMIGQAVGRGLGGVTTAEQRLADFQNIVSSVPDFDPMNPEKLQAMSSAMWRGGFYDQAQDMLNTSQSILKDNALIDLYAAQAEDERRVTAGPDTRTTNKKTYDDLVAEGNVTSTYNDWLDKQDLTSDEKEYERVSNEGTFTGTFEEWKDRNVKDTPEKQFTLNETDPSAARTAEIKGILGPKFDFGWSDITGVKTTVPEEQLIRKVHNLARNSQAVFGEVLGPRQIIEKLETAEAIMNKKIVQSGTPAAAGGGGDEDFEDLLTG